MTIKNFLLAAVALAVIGAGGSISMYYQMLRIEHTKKRELGDKYYLSNFCIAYYLLRTSASESAMLLWSDDIEETKEGMRTDGYSYAEIGIIVDKACKESREREESEKETKENK